MHIDALQKKLIAAVVVALLAFGGIAVWPAVRENRQLRSEISSLHQQLVTTHAETSGLATVAASVKQIRAEISTNNKRIPTQGEVAELLREFTTELQGQQLTDPAITTQPIVTGPDYSQLPIQIIVKGPGMGAFRFVNKVEAMPRLVQFQRLHLQAGDKASDHLEAEMVLHTFMYNTSQESAP